MLIIGERAAQWRERLMPWSGRGVAFESARRPSEGIRTFETASPDAVLLVEEPGRASDLLEALRERPLGRLVEIVALGSVDGHDESEARADVHLDADADASRVVERLEEELGEAIPRDESPAREGGETRSVAGGDGEEGEPSTPALDADAIEDKLRDVRTADYFDVLDIDPASDEETVESAYRRLYARYAPGAVDNDLEDVYRRELEEIADGLIDAYLVLSRPDLRSRYAGSERPRPAADSDG
ncbi:MAG: hypothetical protein ABEL76_15725 [Bradymonadaceae bacterium]